MVWFPVEHPAGSGDLVVPLTLPPLMPQSLPLAPCPAHGGCGTLGMCRTGWLQGRVQLTVCLSLPSHCSAAGEFFPEAAQVAYRMWELSAVAKVEVSTLSPCPQPPLLTASLGTACSLLSRGTTRVPLSTSCCVPSFNSCLSDFGAQCQISVTVQG